MDNLVEQLKRKGNIDIESPFMINIENVAYPFQCLIRGYGAENGMIIDKDFKKIEPIQAELLKMGYGYSCFDIIKSTSSADDFINAVLIADWGKYGL